MLTVSTKRSISVLVYVPFPVGHVHTRSDEDVFALNIDISSNSLVLELCTIDTVGHVEMVTSRFLKRQLVTIQSIQGHAPPSAAAEPSLGSADSVVPKACRLSHQTERRHWYHSSCRSSRS